jgi:hypothetical protein
MVISLKEEWEWPRKARKVTKTKNRQQVEQGYKNLQEWESPPSIFFSCLLVLFVATFITA